MRRKLSSLGLALCMALSMASAAAVPAVKVEQIPPSGTAYAAEQTVIIDGRPVTFQMYALKDANGNGTNYIKLRDLAYALSGTAAQFAVEYDGSIQVVPGRSYTPAGGEMTTPFTGDRSYTGGAMGLKVAGEGVDLTAFTLLDDQGGGYTYFKLRDLGTVLGFGVGWDDAAKRVTLDTRSAAQTMSDQTLTELAKDRMEAAFGAGVCIANAGFVETDDSDTFTVDNGYREITYRRVIGYQTIAQAEEAARQYWYGIYSRQAPGVSDHELDMMRGQLLELDGALYHREMGVGDGGGYPVLDRMISRTATEAVFAAHMDWGYEDSEWGGPFQFSLVLEDGNWKYLERETSGSGAPSGGETGQAAMARAMLDVLDKGNSAYAQNGCNSACLIDVYGDGTKELIAQDEMTVNLYTWENGQLTSKTVGAMAGATPIFHLCQDTITDERGLACSQYGANYSDDCYYYHDRSVSLAHYHSRIEYGDEFDSDNYQIDGREVSQAEYDAAIQRNQELEELTGFGWTGSEARLEAVRAELERMLAG